MSVQRLTSVSVLANDKLLQINDWTFLSKNTAGWNKNTICFNATDNKHKEWVRIEVPNDDADASADTTVEYRLNVIADGCDNSVCVYTQTVYCLADVLRYCMHGTALM